MGNAASFSNPSSVTRLRRKSIHRSDARFFLWLIRKSIVSSPTSGPLRRMPATVSSTWAKSSPISFFSQSLCSKLHCAAATLDFGHDLFLLDVAFHRVGQPARPARLKSRELQSPLVGRLQFLELLRVSAGVRVRELGLGEIRLLDVFGRAGQQEAELHEEFGPPIAR